MHILETDEDYLKGDDGLMFNCIKLALLHFFEINELNGVTLEIPDEDSFTLSVNSNGSLHVSSDNVDIEENEIINDHRSDNGVLFRGVMCVAINKFIPDNCGITIAYQDTKFLLIHDTDGGVSLEELTKETNLKEFDKVSLKEPEPIKPIISNGPMTEEKALDLLNNMQHTGYMN